LPFCGFVFQLGLFLNQAAVFKKRQRVSATELHEDDKSQKLTFLKLKIYRKRGRNPCALKQKTFHVNTKTTRFINTGMQIWTTKHIEDSNPPL
jgi:hypothetical protein